MVALRVEIALHDILFVVPIVCACPAAWGVGNLHQTAAVEEEPCPSAVGSMSPGAVDLVEEEAFDRFGRLVSVEAAVFDRAPLPPRWPVLSRHQTFLQKPRPPAQVPCHPGRRS